MNGEYFSTASALIAELRPDHPRWMETKSDGFRWFFRGQRDASWDLRPGAYRVRPTQSKSGDSQVYFELSTLRTFVRTCDMGGIALPGDSLAFRREWLDLESRPIQALLKEPNGWPPEALYTLLGVAQHHGVPTCLLDWTEKGMVAAYFAARDALGQLFELHRQSPKDAKTLAEKETLAVWAFRRGLTNSLLVTVVELPAATSMNLGAQSGVFTLVKQNVERGQKFYPRFLHDVVPRHQDLLTLILPLKECGNLLRLCSAYGISRAKLFPGLDGAGGMTVEALWLSELEDAQIITTSEHPFP